MKVKDLIQALKGHENKTIYFSQDEEGNGYLKECEVEKLKKAIIIFPFEYASDEEMDDRYDEV